MKIFFLISFIFCQSYDYAQSKSIEISSNEKLTQSFGQSLLPITIELIKPDRSKLQVTFFDIQYLGSNNGNVGKFVAAGKPGIADLVRHPPILINRIIDTIELTKSILTSSIAPDTVFLTFLEAKWADGTLKFKVTGVKVISKNQAAEFSDLFAQQIKVSSKLNFSTPTGNVLIPLEDNKNLILNIKPFFSEKYILFKIAPKKLYSFDKIQNPAIGFDSTFKYANSSIKISYELFNYITNSFLPNKEIKVTKEDFHLTLSKFMLGGSKQGGAKLSCQIKILEINSIFDGIVQLANDMRFINCVIKSKKNDVFSVQTAKTIEKKINEKFADKYFIKDADLSKVFPYKLMGKEYKLYLDVIKVVSNEKFIQVYNQLFIENQ